MRDAAASTQATELPIGRPFDAVGNNTLKLQVWRYSTGAKADPSIELALGGSALHDGLYAQALELHDSYRYVINNDSRILTRQRCWLRDM